MMISTAECLLCLLNLLHTFPFPIAAKGGLLNFIFRGKKDQKRVSNGRGFRSPGPPSIVQLPQVSLNFNYLPVCECYSYIVLYTVEGTRYYEAN